MIDKQDVMKALRSARNLNHRKAKHIISKIGLPPRSHEGDDGDIRLLSTQTGVKLYAKHLGKWWGFVPDEVAGELNSISLDNSGALKDTGTAVFGNGLMLQWGYKSTSGTSEDITFPGTFPHTCFTVFLVGHETGSTGGGTSPELKSLPTTTGFSMSMHNDTDTVYWLAIGN